jgi:hypothetical protein
VKAPKGDIENQDFNIHIPQAFYPLRCICHQWDILFNSPMHPKGNGTEKEKIKSGHTKGMGPKAIHLETLMKENQQGRKIQLTEVKTLKNLPKEKGHTNKAKDNGRKGRKCLTMLWILQP